MECGKNLKIIDTNVICEAANTNYASMDDLRACCARNCARFINHFIHSAESRIAMDTHYEIMIEYERNAPRPGTENPAAYFMLWFYDYLAKMSPEDLIDTQKTGENQYGTFPSDKRLSDFDPADRKFIAVANAHPEHPPIVEGTDCKWWGYKEVLAEHGILIDFLCEEYIKDAYQKKMGN